MKTRGKKGQDPSRFPENDPSKAEDFPGYPHYPAREDIMDQRNDYVREDLDVENLPNSRNKTGVSQRSETNTNNEKTGDSLTPGFSLDDEELDMREGTEADVNEDDLAILNATNDEIGRPQNVSNEDLNTDLDIPGSELDDKNELIGEEDEENNYWSLGSDRRGFNEEDPYSGPKREQE